MALPKIFGARSRNFDHAAAQHFEWKNNRQEIRTSFANLYSRVENEIASGGLWHGANDDFFCGDNALFAQFVEHVRTRKCLEIGSGPFGYLLPARWIEDRAIIEPLAEKYRAEQLRLTGKTFFTDDVKVFASSAETVIPELVGLVEGAIICRNVLDHCDDPLSVFGNIAKYAAPGCYLLLWTDIWHVGGIDDDGHRNITRSPEVIDALLDGLGFNIIRPSARVRDPNEFIEYGRIAQKR